MRQKETINSSGQTEKLEVFDYHFYDEAGGAAFYGENTGIYVAKSDWVISLGLSGENIHYSAIPYKQSSGYSLLTSKTIEDRKGSESFTTTYNYTYSHEDLQVKRKGDLSRWTDRNYCFQAPCRFAKHPFLLGALVVTSIGNLHL